MSGGIYFDYSGLKALEHRFDRLARTEKRELLNLIGALGETQTRARIMNEKEAPDGTPWPAWSQKYAGRRPSGKSLLMSDDHLLDSIAYRVIGKSGVEVGSNMIYAATQFFGDSGTRNIPSRQALGISTENEKEIIQEIDDWFDRQIGS